MKYKTISSVDLFILLLEPFIVVIVLLMLLTKNNGLKGKEQQSIVLHLFLGD